MHVMGRLVSINLSPGKGTMKWPAPAADVLATGLAGDAHAGPWHRQVSLLAQESIERFAAAVGMSIADGEFAENFTTRGLALDEVAIGDRITIGTVLLEVTQIGKACHGKGCTVMDRVGRCAMPKEGIFCRVLRPGRVEVGAPMAILTADPPGANETSA